MLHRRTPPQASVTAPRPQTCHWLLFANAATLQRAVAERCLTAARRAIALRGRFDLVLAGGETPRPVYELLRRAPATWQQWHVYFGDERCLPRDDPGRNSRMAREAWLDHVEIPSGQTHEIPAELGAAEAARRYGALLDGVGRFDLVLLGLGEDGHTGSLFPGHPMGEARGSPDVMVVFDAPKSPPGRVTLSARRFSDTEAAVFLVVGEAKRAAVARWCAGDSIPARFIAPEAGVEVFVEATIVR